MGMENQRHVPTVPDFPGTSRALQVPQTASPLLGPCRGVPAQWQLLKPATPFPAPWEPVPSWKIQIIPYLWRGESAQPPGALHIPAAAALLIARMKRSAQRGLGTQFSQDSWPSTPQEPKINPPPKSTGHLRHFQPSQGSRSRPGCQSIAAKRHQDRSWRWHQRCPNDAWTRNNKGPPQPEPPD